MEKLRDRVLPDFDHVKGAKLLTAEAADAISVADDRTFFACVLYHINRSAGAGVLTYAASHAFLFIYERMRGEEIGKFSAKEGG